MKHAQVAAVILVIAIALIGLFIFSELLVGKQVSGIINSDTTWNGKINIEGNITITNSVTLTIQPGTTVNRLLSHSNRWDTDCQG